MAPVTLWTGIRACRIPGWCSARSVNQSATILAARFKRSRSALIWRSALKSHQSCPSPDYSEAERLTDPYNAKKLAEDLLNLPGLPVEYNRQGYLSLADPTKTLHELIMGRKLRHAGHPILRWHASNAAVQKDPAGNIKLDKEKSRRKIDGVAALVNAVRAAINNPEEPPSVYQTRGILVL